MRFATLLTLLILLRLAAVAEGPTDSVPRPEWFIKIKARYTKPVKDPKDFPPQPPVTPAPRWPGLEWGYREHKFSWNGVALVYDPVNNEALFLGGHSGGMPFGTMGCWALAEDGKSWRELKFTSAILDPLREKALGARKSAKDGEAVARNVFYAAMDAQEAEALKAEPASRIAETVQLTQDLLAALSDSKAEDWEKEAIEHSLLIVGKALAELQATKSALQTGKVDATILKNCFDAQWALDEASDCLASFPTPREQASAALDPASKCIVLFGGSHHDYMTSDTWIYDCIRKSWRQVWPKTSPSPRMGANFTWSAGKKGLVLTGGQTVLNKMVYQQGEMPAPSGEWIFDVKSCQWKGEAGAATSSRIYRAIVQGYNPCWYDAAPRGDPKTTADWLEKLSPNTWTRIPLQPAPAPERDWGTARLDPDRDQIYRWTGGHQADPANGVSTYHPAINRWSMPFVPDIISDRKGMTFAGRPDCANHTYLHYAYDPVSKRLICPSQGGTGIYNPDIGDFEASVDQPFNRHIYETCTTSTPKGVFLWGQGGQTWLFDYKEKAWKRFPVVNKAPAPQCDGSALCYDSKRDALWMTTFLGYQKPSGNIWRLDMKSGQVQTMDPAHSESIGKAKGFNSEIRESVYVPSIDLVLYNNFVAGQEVAYDPDKNRWVVLSNVKKTLDRQGSVSDTLNWDPKRALIWNLNAYKEIYVLKIDPRTLAISETP